MEIFLTEKRKNIILALVFILGTFLIVFHFTDTPKVWVDEGVYTETARNFALHGVLGLQTEPGKFFPINHLLSTGYPVIVPVAGSFLAFGTGIWQARLPMIIYMFILMVLFYLFVKKRYGFYPAILSVLLLLSFSPFYGNGRPVQGEVPGLVFLVLGALFFLFLEEGGFQSRRFAFLGGLAFGLSASTKPIYMLGLFVVLFVALLLWYKKINKKVLLFSFFGFIAPLIFWFYIQFPDKESILKIPSLYFHIASDSASSVPIFEKVLTNFLKFFTESTPMLFLVVFAITLFSFLVPYIYTLIPEVFDKDKIKGKTSYLNISEFIIFSFIIINWVGFMFGTGWYRYFFPANVLLYLIFPASILSLKDLVKKEFFKKVIITIPVILIILQFTHLFFLSDTSFTKKITKNTDLENILGNLDPSKKVFFYGATDSIVFFKGNDYSQYLVMGDFLDTGNKDDIYNNTSDYIFTGASANTDFDLPCYNKNLISGYFLYEKIINCKK